MTTAVILARKMYKAGTLSIGECSMFICLMKVSLNLRRKIWILILVPLVLEVIFIPVLAWLLKLAETDLIREAHATEVTSQITQISGLYYGAAANLTLAAMTRNRKLLLRFDEKVKEIPQELDRLHEMIAGNEDEQRFAEQVLPTGSETLKLFAQIRADLEKGAITDDPDKLRQLTAGAKTNLKRVLVEQAKIMEVCKKALATAPIQASRSRMAVVVWLLAGVILHLVLACWAAHFFWKQFIERLDVVCENATRLAAQQLLNPPLAESDEIARVDHVFHSMSDELIVRAFKERALLENAQDVVCSLDRDLKISKINPACETIWGYSASTLIGTDYLNLVVAEDREATKALHVSLLASQTPFVWENRLQCKGGAIVDMRWSLYWSNDENAFFCVAHDVSEQRRVLRLKQQIVEMVSHDLKTPLTSILGVLELLSSERLGPLGENAKVELAGAELDVNRLLKLVNELLEYERAEAGELVLQRERVQLSEMVDHAVQTVKSLPLCKERSITFAVPAMSVSLFVDRDRIIQVLVNLLANAVNFSQPHGTVEICAIQEPESVELRVVDNGCGLGEEQLSTIFERHHQATDLVSTVSRGLGLPIAKALVEAHRGTIGVISMLGKGSTFWIRLPLKEHTEPDPDEAEQNMTVEGLG